MVDFATAGILTKCQGPSAPHARKNVSGIMESGMIMPLSCQIVALFWKQLELGGIISGNFLEKLQLIVGTMPLARLRLQVLEAGPIQMPLSLR